MSIFTNNTFIFIYVLTIIYFVVLGCIMLAQRGNPIYTHGEQSIKLRMTRSVGIFMFVWAFDYLIYLPDFLDNSDMIAKFDDVFFIITMIIETPALYMVMHAIVQKRVSIMKWTVATTLPFLLLMLWQLFIPLGVSDRLPYHLASVFNILFVIFLLLKYAKEYSVYVERIKSEYSEISGREIFWSWSCFVGFALQVILFLLYIYMYVPMSEYLYWLLSIINAAYLCYCTYKQRPLDIDVVEETIEVEEPHNITPEAKNEEKAFYGIIEQKLDSLCEDKLLFLEPDLTRETLCRRLSISSTYLKLYFHSRGLSFYQYINTLRVEYAYKLMQDNPDMSIREISEHSGFRSQTTFRKMFVEVMGCLPSEIKSKKDASSTE